MTRTPRRICIIGNSGTGKSTLAILLGERYDLPVFHLDQELLSGQFVPLPDDEQSLRHAKLIEQAAWVIDGAYGRTQPERVARADLVIFLSVPRWRVIPRTIRRTLRQERLGISAEAKQRYSYKLFRYQVRYSRRKRLQKLQDTMRQHSKADLLVLLPDSPTGWLRQIEKCIGR